MNIFERHDLLHISLAGRKRIFAELLELGQQEKAVGEMLLPGRFLGEQGFASPVPGIVRREENAPRPGFVPVGFASWRSGENGRLRVASFVRPEEILARSSPEDIAAKIPQVSGRTHALKALGSLCGIWNVPALRLGVWGSAALEIESGHLYTHALSDLDIRLLPVARLSVGTLELALERILAAEKTFEIRIDAELRTPGGYGVSLKEFLGKGATVLGKGLADALILQKQNLFPELGERFAQAGFRIC